MSNAAQRIAASMGANSGQSGSNQSNQTNDGSKTDDRPATQVYGNLGYQISYWNEEGELTRTFISIPYGAPIDTQNPMVGRYDNEENNRRIEAGNAILEEWKGIADSLQPGEEIVLPVVPGEEERTPEKGEVLTEIRVQLKKKRAPGNSGTAASGSNNPYLSALKPALSVVNGKKS